ncbi:LysR family transcriptional regulator [Nostoc sp. FACHB-888]|uniref:LysR family transcriptional regulator n=1 Tax=Nostoc sp. FACHB-888 TaxID=2692842 RepID=UPI001F5552AC|nr:LysR family transcriptional regulator [Nostoc sp. FACHB-888]
MSNLLAFVRVAEAQSFAQASNDLGLSTSAVSKAVARLEADLGVKLFHRTTRSISLTSDGVQFYEGCQQLLGELDALEAEIQGNRATPKGQLTVSVPPSFGRVCLVSIIKEFTQTFPEISLDILMDDRQVDLAKEAVDVVIRTGQLSDSANLIARQLFTYPLVVCGSPTYFKQHGRPQHPEQLQQHSCLNFRNRATGRIYPWSFTLEYKAEQYAVSGSVVFDNADAIVRSTIAGLGLSQMPGFLAAEAISSGNLVEVLNAYRPLEVPVWICYLDRRFVAPRIRSFVEFVAVQKEVFTAMCIYS